MNKIKRHEMNMDSKNASKNHNICHDELIRYNSLI